MTDPGTNAGAGRSFVATLKADVRRAWSDLSRSGWIRSGRKTFDELQAFYLTDPQRDSLTGMKPVGRWFHLVWWLFQALFFKLTPTRRVILVVALVLTVAAGWSFSIGKNVEATVNIPFVGSALLLVLLMLELRDKLMARSELEAGRAVQMALMPDESPKLQGWDAWLYTRPANDVGGDLVDYLSLGGGRYGISLADVAGKALPAALLMAKVQSTLRALCTEFDSLTELGDHVNRILCRDGLPDRFVTLVYLEVAGDSRHVRYLNAGHMPPVVLRQGSAETLSQGDIAMGLLSTAQFTEQSVDVAPGETLIVYSDGVTEAMNEAGDFFGDERFQRLLPGLASLQASQIGARILDEVQDFVGEARTHDDLSLVILKRSA
jgi:sigma-B regulation protein RsbU (phosphoserine phosphatase)